MSEINIFSKFPAFGGKVVGYNEPRIDIQSKFPAFGGRITSKFVSFQTFGQPYDSYQQKEFLQPWTSSAIGIDFPQLYSLRLPVTWTISEPYSDFEQSQIELEFSMPYQLAENIDVIVYFQHSYDIIGFSSSIHPVWGVVFQV